MNSNIKSNFVKNLTILSLVFVILFISGCANNAANPNTGTVATNTGENIANTQTTPTVVVDTTTDNGKKYQGEVLAGNNAPYLVFNYADYQKALEDKEVIFFYFYADWSTTAKADQKAIYDGFNKITNDKVIGFRINFDDEFTDSAEAGLATQFGVKEARTKVILKNGEVVQKTTSTSWNENDYVRQIAQYLG